MGIRATIGWKYVGVAAIEHIPEHTAADIARVGVGNAKPLQLDDGHLYWVSHGFYVPYFEPHKGAEQFRDFEKMVSQLTVRFFRNAQPEINREYRAEQIDELRTLYQKSKENQNDRSEQRTAGSRLVGAMINRMDRLAKAIIEIRRHGRAPDILEIESGMTLDKMEKQLSAYYTQLMLDTELVSQVRRNHGIRLIAKDVAPLSKSPRFDHDGVLHEMIQEVGKAAAFRLDHAQAECGQPSPLPTDKEERNLALAETNITQGRVSKIGRAMRCVDDICKRLEKVSDKDTFLSRTPTGALLMEMGMAAKVLLGIKNEEVVSYTQAEMVYESLQKDLNQIYFAHIKDADQKTLQSLMVIQRGFDLIKDMVSTRLSCDEIYWAQGSEPPGVMPLSADMDRITPFGDPRARMANFVDAADRQIALLEHCWAARMEPRPTDRGR